MEGFFLIIVLVTALLVSVESERPDQEQRSVHTATLTSERGVTEIGRASCRERV